MQYPNTIQYKQAVQDPESFATLNNDLQPVMDGYEPVLASGNFAVVFKMLKNGKKHALKCFTKEIAGRAERQKMIVEFIKQNPSKHFVDYHYLENELWIAEDEGMEVPVTWMEWVEAPTLGEKIKDYCESKDTVGLQTLVENFREFAVWILQQPFAHGDLKHDNLLVKDDGTLVMVDYDGMFIPAFDGLLANELGSKAYQHPKRAANFFNADLDDFSIAVIYISLLALVEQPELYGQYSNGQNIIFDSGDFINPAKSTLMSSLKDSINTGVKVSELAQICKNPCQSITNMKELIDAPVSRREYQLMLEETKEKILSHFKQLSHINQLGKSQFRVTEEILESQIIITTQLFEKLQKKLPLKSFSEETGLTEEWWNSLSEEWRKLVLFNIEKADKPSWEFGGIFTTIESLKNSFRRFNPIEKDYEFQKITIKLDKLKTFVCFKEFDLTPISRLTNLTSVRLENPIDLKAISFLNDLTQLRIDHANDIFGTISNLKKLKKLEIYHDVVGWGSLNSLSSMSYLEELSLIEVPFLSFISSLINLRKLCLIGSTLGLENISSLSNLIELKISHNTADLSPISTLNSLTTLTLNYNKSDLSSIQSLTNLTNLNIVGNEADLNPISSLIQLRELKIVQNKLNLNPIRSLKNLKILDLSHNTASLKPISYLINLTNLNLYNNQADLDPISSLTNLTYLNLEFDKSELSVMSVFDNLNNLPFWSGINIQPIKKLINHIINSGGEVIGIDLNEFMDRKDKKEGEDLPF